MGDDHIHRAVSEDGTALAGRVHGQGPPLVIVSGVGDGEGRSFLLPNLSERFTCYSMSLRGRGLSSDHPDHSPERLVEDITAFADSIAEPVGLVGHSRGAALALIAAARAARVFAVAVYEPHAIEFYIEEDVARAVDALERMRRAAHTGEPADAARIFFRDITLPDSDELTILSTSGAFELTAPNIPVIIRDIAQWRLPRDSQMELLEQITMPVLIMHGSRTHRFYAEVVHHLAEQLIDPHVREVPHAGHFTPVFAPEAIADDVAEFLEAAVAST
jgi:pimeloyl-ACP methyl ester carboxylesterase